MPPPPLTTEDMTHTLLLHLLYKAFAAAGVSDVWPLVVHTVAACLYRPLESMRRELLHIHLPRLDVGGMIEEVHYDCDPWLKGNETINLYLHIERMSTSDLAKIAYGTEGPAFPANATVMDRKHQHTIPRNMVCNECQFIVGTCKSRIVMVMYVDAETRLEMMRAPGGVLNPIVVED